jgi:hypothetical protein
VETEATVDDRSHHRRGLLRYECFGDLEQPGACVARSTRMIPVEDRPTSTLANRLGGDERRGADAAR